MMEWKEELQQHTKEAEKIVQGYLPEETGHQKLLIEASNYSVLVGGKRLRPMIMLESLKLLAEQEMLWSRLWRHLR